MRYKCPATQNLVETSLNPSAEDLRRLGDFKLSLWCPHCQIGHKITARDTIAGDAGAGAAAA